MADLHFSKFDNSRNIANRIESEMSYPGQIKVNVIRESRVTDYAK